jgi:hypothetical protein
MRKVNHNNTLKPNITYKSSFDITLFDDNIKLLNSLDSNCVRMVDMERKVLKKQIEEVIYYYATGINLTKHTGHALRYYE